MKNNKFHGATLVRAVFTDRDQHGAPSATVVAVRWNRHGAPSQGIELYTTGPDGLEEFLRYVRPAGHPGRGRTDVTAEREIAIAEAMATGDSSERYAAMELS